MRVFVSKENTDQEVDIQLERWLLAMPSGENYFLAHCPATDETVKIQASWQIILGCQRLFIYDPVNDGLKMCEVQEDAIEYIGKTLDAHFAHDYEVFF